MAISGTVLMPEENGSDMADSYSGREVYLSSRKVALVSLATVLLLACLVLGFTILALQIQSGVRVYVVGESLWSKGRQQAVYHLDYYAQTGDPGELQKALEGLSTPLSDSRARHALEENPPDTETATKAFMAAGNHPADIDNAIWLYLHFSEAPYFKEAVDTWIEGERIIRRLQDIAIQLQNTYASGNPSAAELSTLRQELRQINREAVPLERRFLDSLAAGARWLRNVLIVLTILLLVLVTVAAVGVFLWATRSISRSEYKFRATFEHAAVGMAQITPDGHFTDVNDALCQILGQPRELLLRPTSMKLPTCKTIRLISTNAETLSGVKRKAM